MTNPTPTAHTPLPWRVEVKQYGNRLMQVKAGYGNICIMGSSVSKEANARLIAAAPSLLEALEAMVEASWSSHAVVKDEARAIARKVIALARGDTP